MKEVMKIRSEYAPTLFILKSRPKMGHPTVGLHWKNQLYLNSLQEEQADLRRFVVEEDEEDEESDDVEDKEEAANEKEKITSESLIEMSISVSSLNYRMFLPYVVFFEFIPFVFNQFSYCVHCLWHVCFRDIVPFCEIKNFTLYFSSFLG